MQEEGKMNQAPAQSWDAHAQGINALASDEDGTIFSCADDATFAVWLPTGADTYHCVLRQWFVCSC